MSKADLILRAMEPMAEFTVADLVRACDAPPATVRTVLRRNADLLEELGPEETGRRGGRWKRYRVRPEAITERRRVLLGEGVSEVPVEGEIAPSGLLAAEELLLDPASVSADAALRDSLLRRARRYRDESDRESSTASVTALAHSQAVDALILLVEGERDAEVEALEVARELVEESERLLPDNNELTPVLRERINLSPLRNLPSPTQASRPSYKSLRETGEAALTTVVQIAGKIAATYPLPAASPEETPFRFKPTRPTGRRLALQAKARARQAEAVGEPVPMVSPAGELSFYTRSRAPIAYEKTFKARPVVHENVVVTVGKRPVVHEDGTVTLGKRSESKRYDLREIPVERHS